MTKALYEIGETPPLGEVPRQMYASVIRQNRFGEPKQAFRTEVVDTPAVGRGQVLVYVMAAGINYNNVWSSLETTAIGMPPASLTSWMAIEPRPPAPPQIRTGSPGRTVWPCQPNSCR